MFKKLLTTMLVLTIVVMAGSAIAGGDYKVYGKLHTSLNMLNNGDESQFGMTSNTSRFGIKGNNELNENFTFIWQFESKLMIADGSGTQLATRNTYVGFKHATAGQIRVGKHDTPFKTLGRKVELFADEMGDFRTLTSLGGSVSWDNRLPEVFAYVSPDFSGFSVFLATMMDQNDKLNYLGDDYKSATAFSGLASYSKDAIYVGIAMESRSESYADSYNDGTSDVYGDGPSAIRFAGSYTADKFKVTALFQTTHEQFADADDAGAPMFSDFDGTTYGLGVRFLASEKWAIKGQYYMSSFFGDAEDDAATTDMDEGDWDSSMFALGVDHIINKNVKLYAQWAGLSNGDMVADEVALGGGQSGFGGSVNGAAIMEGDPAVLTGYENPSGFSVGTVITW